MGVTFGKGNGDARDDIIARNRDLLRRHSDEFRRIFGVPLQMFMNPITGFDLIRFDERVVKSGDRQMSAVVLEKYGQPGVDLVLALIRGIDQ